MYVCMYVCMYLCAKATRFLKLVPSLVPFRRKYLLNWIYYLLLLLLELYWTGLDWTGWMDGWMDGCTISPSLLLACLRGERGWIGEEE